MPQMLPFTALGVIPGPHPPRVTADPRTFRILAFVNPRHRLLQSAGKRVTDPAEALAQQVTERVVDLVVSALDVNELAARVDVNAILSRVDIDAMLKKVDLNALVSQVDVNELAQRIDVEGLVEKMDLGAVIARSSRGMTREALDAVRCQAAGLDQFIDRWVARLLRRKRPAPQALIPAGAEP
jgi:hypothetical protein